MQRYMDFSPAAKESAIRLLDAADGGEIGNMSFAESIMMMASACRYRYNRSTFLSLGGHSDEA